MIKMANEPIDSRFLIKMKMAIMPSLFGAHLLIDFNKGRYTVILVESEKTAIVGDILLTSIHLVSIWWIERFN